MTTVVDFPHHGRASKVSRAAKVVRISALTPASDAFAVQRTADHHSAGMLSRCHHLDTADAFAVGSIARKSKAMASLDGHRSITSRNDWIASIAPRLGQSVLNCKDKLAYDANKILGHTVRMADSETEAEFKQGFMNRTREARIARALKQWEIADALGMPQDKYKQYETRSLLPHHLIGRFCIICRIDPEWLVTGRGKMVPKEPAEAPGEPARALARKSRSKRAA